MSRPQYAQITRVPFDSIPLDASGVRISDPSHTYALYPTEWEVKLGFCFIPDLPSKEGQAAHSQIQYPIHRYVSNMTSSHEYATVEDKLCLQNLHQRTLV